MTKRMPGGLVGFVSGVAVAATILSAPAVQAQETFKIGVVGFYSGPAAESYGVPTSNAAKMMVEAFNKGTAPAPYDKKGFGGMSVEMILVDEAGGATKQVQDLRNLYQREKVDAVLGYNSSGDCLAIAPVADELKSLLILADCGTPRIFEEADYQYVFRTASHGAMDNIALAQYLKKRKIKVGTIDLINQDYAYGQDSRADFLAALTQTSPDYKIQADLLPKFNAGQYGSEISAISRQPADILYTSLWGGDLQAFLLQSAPRGLYKSMPLVLPAADHVFSSLGDKMPEGVIFGARGAYGVLAQKSALNDWFVKAYKDEFKATHVTQGSYRTTQALMGLKLAVEKAMAANGGKKPSPEQIGAALKGSEWDTPGGKIRMALGNGHQAIQPVAIGRTHFDPATRLVVATDVEFFPADCVNPPAGTKAQDWIKAGFPNAKCN